MNPVHLLREHVALDVFIGLLVVLMEFEPRNPKPHSFTDGLYISNSLPIISDHLPVYVQEKLHVV